MKASFPAISKTSLFLREIDIVSTPFGVTLVVKNALAWVAPASSGLAKAGLELFGCVTCVIVAEVTAPSLPVTIIGVSKSETVKAPVPSEFVYTPSLNVMSTKNLLVAPEPTVTLPDAVIEGLTRSTTTRVPELKVVYVGPGLLASSV